MSDAAREIKSKFTIAGLLESRGHALKSNACRCPFHDDKTPSFTVDREGKLWNCHAGCGGGDVVNLMARFEDKPVEQLLKEWVVGKVMPARRAAQAAPAFAKPPVKSDVKSVEKCRYTYHDALGREAFKVVRYIPKTFRQIRPTSDGKWAWGMDGVERVLYRLPEIQKSETVWITEGEKDADAMAVLGFCATCNVGGAGKWLDGYSESLAGKDVAICGDNDEPGQAHVELVFEKLAGKVATARIVKVPDTYKDVSEYIESFAEKEEARVVLQSLYDGATPFVKGLKLPLKFIYEIEDAYKKHVRDLAHSSFDLGKWIPSLGREVRALVPGELVLILGATGIGKTALLSNIAMHAAPLKTLFFEMELPDVLMYERLVSWQTKMSGPEIEQAYKQDDLLGKEALAKGFGHLVICTEPRLTPELVTNYVAKSELKFGERPKVVLLDYIQLVAGKGNSRYERASQAAEEIKITAKATNTVIFVASQIGRKGADDDASVTLFDGKDSGSLENSAGLVLGAWRDPKDASLMHLRILKNTKGKSGAEILCNYEGKNHRITERSSESDSHYAQDR